MVVVAGGGAAGFGFGSGARGGSGGLGFGAGAGAGAGEGLPVFGLGFGAGLDGLVTTTTAAAGTEGASGADATASGWAPRLLWRRRGFRLVACRCAACFGVTVTVDFVATGGATRTIVRTCGDSRAARQR